MSTSPKKICLFLLGVAATIALLGVFAAFGPPGLYAKSASPEFCGSCHVMESQYEAWFHAGAHRRQKCVECHLPNDHFANHLLWKSLDGLKDSAKFHLGIVSDNIRISAHGAQVVQANCLRCHEETMALTKEDRKCWDCHRRLSHKRAGAILTLNP